MAHPEPVRGLGEGEVPQRAHPSPDGVEDQHPEPEEEDDPHTGGGPVAVLFSDQGKRRADEQEDQPPGDHLEQDRPDQLAVGNGQHRAFRCLVARLDTPRGPAEQVGPQPLGHRLGQIAEPHRRPLGAGRGHLDLGQTEDPGREGLEHIDALDPVETDPLGLLLEQSAVDAQLPAEEVVPRDRHRDQPSRHHQRGEYAVDDQGDDVRSVAVAGLLAGQAEHGEHRQDPEDPAPQGHRGQRVESERLLGRAADRIPARGPRRGRGRTARSLRVHWRGPLPAG